jgi:hypothetical protein
MRCMLIPMVGMMRVPKVTGMTMLLILNKMTKKHLIAGDYVLTVEISVVFADLRYMVMMMLLVRLNLRYLLLMVNMTLMLTLLGRLRLIKSLHVMSVAEPPELFQLKCLSHAPGVVTHLNRNNPSVPQI